MAEQEIEQAFVAAAEIAKKVPKHLQEVAFNRALDHLLAQRAGGGGGITPRVKASTAARTTHRGGGLELLSAIDRARYPDIGSTSRIADRALKVLQLANDDFGIDGLTAAEVAKILTEKFRLTVRANSIIKALERETDTVDIRQSPERGRTFHLMAPGEEYLTRLRAGGAPEPQRKPARRSKARRSKSSDSRESRKVSKPEPKPGKPVARKQSGRPGPKAAISQLVTAGFFGAPRTISQIQEELKHRRGHTFSVQELSPALVRSLRDHTITRERNASGQYEYSAA